MLFPPGMLALISVVGLLILATVMLVGSSIIAFAGDIDVSIKAGIQLSSLVLLFVFVVFPALMVFKGNKKFTVMSSFYSLVLLIFSSLLSIVYIFDLINVVQPIRSLVVCIASSLVAFMLLRSNNYRILKEFFYYLKKT